MSYKTIRAVTAITGITEGALRYYDEKGVVKPTKKKPTGRHEWLYDDEAIRQLCLIKLYTFIGIPVRIAGEMLENGMNFSNLMLNMQIGAIKHDMAQDEYKISLAESLIKQGAKAEFIDSEWLVKVMDKVRTFEKETTE